MLQLPPNPTISDLISTINQMGQRIESLESRSAEWLSTEQAGKRLGNLTSAAIAARCKRGQIPAQHCKQLRGRWLIHIDYINQQRQKQGLKA